MNGLLLTRSRSPSRKSNVLWTCLALALCLILMADASSSSHPSRVSTVRDDYSSGAGTSTDETSIDAADLSETETEGKESSTDVVVVRFYLIRHGETQANEKGLVLGQTDSPLSDSGQQQARALGRDDLIAKQHFWRRYTSDLGRAQRTTNLILGEDQTLEQHHVQLEPLLREVGKGVRELYPKTLTYDEATERFIREKGPDEPFPLLESEDEVVARVYQWMFQVVRDAIQEYRQQCHNAGGNAASAVYPVFAVSHSATLRAVIGRLVRSELPTSIDFTPVGRDGAHPGSLKVPNTSVTIIDIVPRNMNDELWDVERKSQVPPPNPSSLWHARLKTLTYTGHYHDNV